MVVESRAYARAGLLGNPSDGYFGKIIAISVKNFWADVFLQESQDIQIETHEKDLNRYRSVRELVERINLYGYYGGIRLIKAAIKNFTNTACPRISSWGIRISRSCMIPQSPVS